MPRQVTDNSEPQVILDLLRAVDRNETLTQRSVAHDLGIALGLVNSYLKRCIGKGLIKVKQAPNKRFAYYLTPKGFSEKTRLTAEFLSQSLSLFRQAHESYDVLLKTCAKRNYRRLALCGVGDLANIVKLLAREYPFEIVAIIDNAPDAAQQHGMPLVASASDLPEGIDACIFTALHDSQAKYDALIAEFPAHKVFVPSLLDLIVSPDVSGANG